MEEKKTSLSLGQIAGALYLLSALLLLVVYVLRPIKYFFNYQTLLVAVATGFFGAVLFMKRRDNMLLIGAGVMALVVLLFGGLIAFVADVLLMIILLAMATPYLPQLKELAQKAWFVPAIVTLLGELFGIRSFGGLLFALSVTAATLLCGMWLAYPDGMPKTAAAPAGDDGETSVSAPEVDGYCELFKHVLLLLLTFGIWNLIWIYRMTRYLNRVGGEEPRNPTTKLLLCLFVPFYTVYWTYKSAQRVDQLAAAVGVESKLATWCLLLAALIPVLPPVLLQEKINTIIDVERGTRKATFDPAEKTIAQVSAAAKGTNGYFDLFVHLLLLVLTGGIWNYIWIYRMTAYLNRVEGEEKRNPVTKLLLCMFVPLYAVYWIYKSCQRIDKLAAEVGVKSELSVLCLILCLVVGMVPQVLMQEKVNEIIVTETSRPAEAAPVGE